MIEDNPSFGCRTVANLLEFNKNTVLWVFQLRGWQVRKRPVGFRSRIEAWRSRGSQPNERWATDRYRVWTGRDGWATLALVIDCFSRELLGWHVSQSGKSRIAESALEQALIASFGTLGRVKEPFLLRSDNGLVFYQPQLHGAAQKLWPEAGVHHALHATVEWAGRADDPHAQGAVHPPPPLRNPATRQSRDR